MAIIQLNRTKTGVTPVSLEDGELFIDQLNGLVWWADNLGALHSFPLLGPISAAQSPALTGDVTKAGGAVNTAIVANAVTNAKLAKMATGTIKANVTGGSADPQDVTYAAFKTALALTISDVAGLSLAPVRQAVLSGPNSAGSPSYLPASTGALSITTSGLVTTPLVVTAANGFNATGSQDYVKSFNVEKTWSGLAANTTNYLFINANTGTLGSTTLAPIYQYGGGASGTNGQFTFNIIQMLGYLGNGSSAVATPLVFIGEATTNGSNVTSAVAYAYQGYWESAWTNTLFTSGAVSYTTNLGIQPKNLKFVIECLTGEFGYSTGDQIDLEGHYWNQFTKFYTRNTVGMSLVAALTVNHKSTGAINYATAANWRYRMIASRGW